MADKIKLILSKPHADGGLAIAVIKEALAQSKQRALSSQKGKSFSEHLADTQAAMQYDRTILLGTAEAVGLNEKLLVRLRGMYTPDLSAMTGNEALLAINEFYDEMLAEAKALATEADNEEAFGTALNTVGEFKHYRNAITYADKRLLLDQRLMRLLEELLDNNNQFVGHSALFDALWNEEDGTQDYLESHDSTVLNRRLADYINKLRDELKKLDGKDHVQNRRGVGYRFIA